MKHSTVRPASPEEPSYRSLASVCEFIADCEHKTAPTQVTGYPSIRTPNIGRGRLSLDGFNRVSEQTYAAWTRRGVPREGDLILAREAPVGNVAIMPPGLHACLGQRTVLIRPDRSRVNPAYLLYLLLGSEVQTRIHAMTQGATVAHLNVADIRALGLPDLPSRSVQDRIADILSAYDDLIENNTKRIKILEEMARSLYREWFVSFRFPGHEKVKMVSSALGKVPEGWIPTTLGYATTKIGSGATPRGGKEAYQNEGISLIRSLNIYDYAFEFADLAHIDEVQAEALANVTVQALDVLLNITGASVARCALVPSDVLPARVNQHVAIVRADPMRCNGYFLLDTLNSEHNKARLLSFAQGGATREALTKEVLSGFPILLPPAPLLSQYAEVAGAVHSMRDALLRRVRILRATRDLLLPRLISGEVSVISDV